MRRSRRASNSAVGRHVLYALVWAAVLILSSLAYGRGADLGGTAPWAGLLHPLLFGLTAWPVFRKFVEQGRWLTIPNAVLGLTYVSMGLGSIYFVIQYDTLPFSVLRRPTAVREALLTVLVGVVSYRIAAHVAASSRIARTLPKLPVAHRWSRGVRLGVLLAVGIAICAKLYLAATGSFGYLTGTGGIANMGIWSILSYVSQAGLLALAGAYFYWFSGASLSPLDHLFLVVATVLLGGLGLLSGMKQDFVFVILAVIIPYAWTHRDRGADAGRRVKELAAGVAVMLALIAVFAVNPLYRAALEEFGETESRIQQAPEAAGMVLDRLSSQAGAASLVNAGIQNVWARLSIFPYLIGVISQVPEAHDFKHFDRYLSLPAMVLVPRVVWPHKPANSSGREFQRSYISSFIVFSTTPSVFGWAYIELGAAGAALVMLALGAIAGFAETYLADRQHGRLAAILLYTALFVVLVDIEADPFWQLGGAPKLLLVAASVYLLLALPGALGARLLRGTAYGRRTVRAINR